MQAIIFAAGLGERLGSLTDGCPKALVRVSGRELIARVMDFIDHEGIRERMVVAGFEAEKLEQFLKERYPDTMVVRNPDYRAGNILSMKAAIPHIRGEFMIMNADHIYPGRMLRRILDSRDGIMAVCDFDRNLGADDMKVKLDDMGHLAHIGKALCEFDGGYIGMTYCGPKYVDRYREALFATVAEKGNGACVENVLGTLAKGPVNKIGVCDTSGIPWLEVDNQNDLRHAERTLNERPDFLL